MKDPDFSKPWNRRGINVGGRKLPPASAYRRPTHAEPQQLPVAPPLAPPIPPPTIAKAKVVTRKIDVSPEQFARLQEAANAAGITIDELIEQLLQQGDSQ
jgi:hypothetical protein